MSEIDPLVETLFKIHVTIPPDPQWRCIKGQNGIITYNAVWLAANALDHHMFINGQEVRLEYLSIEEMPIILDGVSAL